MPSDVMLKTMNGVNRVVQKVSFGKLGWQFGGMPVIELTTIGRKSGAPRTVLLTSPLEDDGRHVLVASRGGDDHHPAWYLNLRDNPEVKVSVKGGPVRTMHAHIADADERARMWPLIADKYRNYRGYQEKTSREIPLVVLEDPA